MDGPNRLEVARERQQQEEIIRDMIRTGNFKRLQNGDCIFDFGGSAEIRGGEYVQRIADWDK